MNFGFIKNLSFLFELKKIYGKRSKLKIKNVDKI